MKKFFYIVSCLALFTCCNNRKALAPAEFLNFLNSEKSGLKLQKEFNQVNYKLQLQPPEVLALKNLSEKTANGESFKKEYSYYRNKLNFIFLIEDALESNNRVKLAVFDKDMYSKMLLYANSELKNDFKLVQGNDTLICSVVHLEPANSIQPIFRLSLAFNGVDTLKKEYTLVYNDNLFMNGPIKFYFPKQVFENLPDVKI